MDIEIIRSKLEEALQENTYPGHPVVSVIETHGGSYVLGWNGPTLEGMDPMLLLGEYENKDDRPSSIHSEIRAICNAAKYGIPTEGGTIYMNEWFCCEPCAGAIVNAGIRRFVTPDEVYEDKSRHILVPELRDHPYIYNFKRAEQILREVAVEILIEPALRLAEKL